VLPAPPAQPGPIETWPPLPPTQSAVGPISPITGQLRRPAPLALASVCFWLAGLGWAGAYALLWWRAASVSGFHQAARILTWTAPEPVSFWAIFMVMLTALLTVMVIGAAVAIGHNAWRGRAWTPLGGLISVVLVAGLSWLLHPWAISAAIPFAVGVGLLWLPGVRRHFAAVSAPPAGPANVPIDPTPALYGPYHPIGG
jgi:hypothetical protein